MELQYLCLYEPWQPPDMSQEYILLACQICLLERLLLPNSRSNQNQNQIKPKIWKGSIIAWFLSCRRHAQNSSDVTLAFEDAD